jgi:hypothetical protein
MKLRLFTSSLVLTVTTASALLLVSACSSSSDGATVGGGASSSGGSGNLGGSGNPSGNGGSAFNLGGNGSSQSGAAGQTNSECTAEFAAAELRPVHLAFAFDVSGSMGKLDEPYHDPALKWRPVVAATRAFFEDPSSAGISASLTFFPAQDDRCDASSYVEPDVASTALPSDAFGAAIAAIDPKKSSDWRGGTPTLAVVQGNVEYLTALNESDPETLHALVLVTDGYPNGCDDDEIATVAAAIEGASSQFPTYVIGVKNPAGGPDTVTDLESLAKAGSSEPAIFIDTGDPEQTSADLKAAIARIRERSIACDAPIPPTPGGDPFDPQKVNVSMQLGAEPSQLGYDPECEAAAGWRYDDVDAPKSIVLCPTTCQVVQQDATAKLSVAFGCDTVPVVK